MVKSRARSNCLRLSLSFQDLLRALYFYLVQLKMFGLDFWWEPMRRPLFCGHSDDVHRVYESVQTEVNRVLILGVLHEW